MGTIHQLHRAAACAAKGIRQFQKADRSLDKDHEDATIRHLKHGLHDFERALEHLGKAADDAVSDVMAEINAGNDELQKCLDALDDGKSDRAEKHYDKALSHYDMVLDMLDS